VRNGLPDHCADTVFPDLILSLRARLHGDNPLTGAILSRRVTVSMPVGYRERFQYHRRSTDYPQVVDARLVQVRRNPLGRITPASWMWLERLGCRYSSAVCSSGTRMAVWKRPGSESGTNEAVVFGVGADPHPCHRIPSQPARSAMVISDSNAEAVCAASQSTETERGMMGIAPPQMVILDCQSLNVNG
jgi:hypothetical protein